MEDNKLPQFALNEFVVLREKVVKLKNSSTVQFGFITDIHINEDETKNGVRLFTKFCNEGVVDFAVNGGDLFTSDDQVFSEAIDEISKVTNQLNNMRIPTYIVRGNHDVNGKPRRLVDYISPLEWSLFSQQSVDSTQESREDNCYFVDDNKKRIRFIFVNTNNSEWNDEIKEGEVYRMTARQFQWIASTALNLPSQKWQAVMIGHIKAFDNSVRLFEIINAYKSGSIVNFSSRGQRVQHDFSSQGPMDFIAYINGHQHIDIDEYRNGVLCIGTLCSLPKPMVGLAPLRPLNTLNEYAWDIISIDRENRKIHCTRYGAGEDRNFDY